MSTTLATASTTTTIKVGIGAAIAATVRPVARPSSATETIEFENGTGDVFTAARVDAFAPCEESAYAHATIPPTAAPIESL